MPRQVDHDTRRCEIVQAVWLVMAEQGLAAVSVRSVAAAAGSSVGRIQHYFASKDELVQASARAMVQIGTDTYREDTVTSSAADRLREALGHPIRRAGDRGPGIAIWYAYLSAATTDPQIAAILTEGKRGQEKLVAGLLRELGIHRAPTRARTLIAIADGLTQRVLIGDLSSTRALQLLQDQLPH